MNTVTVEVSGPIFDGRAERAAEKALDEWGRDLAELGNVMVRANLNTVLRHQTPYYRTRIAAQREAPGWKVTDQGVIYGPWLEGTGSRNRTTRFKGYATFRRTTQQLDAKAVSVGEAAVRRHIGEMNG